VTWQPTRLKYLAASPITNGLGEAAQDGDPEWPRYIRTTDIASPRTLHDDRRATLPPDVARRALVQQDDLLMCAAGSLGKVYLHSGGEPACYAGYLVRFRPRQDLVDPRFIAYWAQSQPFLDQIAVGAVRSTIDNFSAGKYQQMELVVPSLQEQRRVADFLDGETGRLDRLIDLRNHERRLLVEERLDGETATAVEAGDVTWLPLRRVISKWIDYRGATPTKTTSGVLLVTASNIKRGAITFESEPEFIDAEDYRTWMRRGLPERGDVLLTTEAPLGEVAQVEDAGVALAQRVILLRPDSSVMSPRWLYWCLRSRPVQGTLFSLATGSTALGIKADRLRGVVVPVPSLASQAQLAARLDGLMTSAEATRPLLQHQSALLLERRHALVTEAVTGQFEVTTARGVA